MGAARCFSLDTQEKLFISQPHADKRFTATKTRKCEDVTDCVTAQLMGGPTQTSVSSRSRCHTEIHRGLKVLRGFSKTINTCTDTLLIDVLSVSYVSDSEAVRYIVY